MNVREAIKSRRSIRKFLQTPINHTILTDLVDAARLCASGANLQPLKYAVLDNRDIVQAIFPLVKWAGYLPDWNPAPMEGPPAYIAVFGDTTISSAFETDAGAAVTTMMLAAVELGLATCWLGAIDRPALQSLLGFDHRLRLLYLLAVGYPDQESVIRPIAEGNCKYYFDSQGILQVPKRPLADILLSLPKNA